jgi:protein-tyrosine-phosphatase
MKILVLSASDSIYGPMVQGFLNYYKPKNMSIDLYGINQANKVNKVAVSLMNSVGIDISNYEPTQVDISLLHSNYDGVITITGEAHDAALDKFNADHIYRINGIGSIDMTQNKKDLKKALKKVRKQIQVFCEQFVEHEVNATK